MNTHTINRKTSTARKEILKIPNVTGIGIGNKETDGKDTDKKSLLVFVEKKLPKGKISRKFVVPKTAGGVETDVIETGLFDALNSEAQIRRRPIPAGVSISTPKTTAGTLGIWAYKKSLNLGYKKLLLEDYAWIQEWVNKFPKLNVFLSDEPFAVTNNHVVGSVFEGESLKGLIGWAVQPGTYDDENWAENIFGVVHKVHPLYKGTTDNLLSGKRNYVDCALIRPDSNGDVDPHVFGGGKFVVPKGVRERAEVGLPVWKTGRTTGLTEGAVKSVHTSLKVGGYVDDSGAKNNVLFEDQILISPGTFSAGGDSGSAVFDYDYLFTGLLFAGSPYFSAVSPARKVLNTLGVYLKP